MMDAHSSGTLAEIDPYSVAGLLSARFEDAAPQEILTAAIEQEFENDIALVSSFGTDSVVLLHMVSEIDRNLPVIFLDTGKHFPETLEYRDRLADRLGLTGVRDVCPDAAALKAFDPFGALWIRDADECCRIRKTEPLEEAVEGFSAWITGRKRFQNAQRSAVRVFEADGPQIKVNPLANWSARDILHYRDRHGLPAHPLYLKGYGSVGCAPCTEPVKTGEDLRAGRWRGSEKTECGIHITSKEEA